MFEEADSLGVSQGQGRGFAQVFDSIYNPVFKEETARLIEKDKASKKEIDKDISGLDATVWKKAQPALQEKMKELYSYTMQNHRNITKGNTPEKLEYQKLISDIQLFTKEQKLQEDLWIKQFNNVALDKKGTYEPEALNILQKYFEDPNLNDPTLIANLPLSFNALEHTSKLKNIVKDISTKTSLDPGFKDLNDNTVYKKFVSTVDSKIEEEAKRLWNNLPNSGKQYYEDDVNNYIQSAKNFARESASQTVKGKTPELSLSKEAEKKPNQIILNKPISFSQKVGATKTPIYGEDYEAVGFTDSETVSLASTGFNVPDVASYTPNQIKNMNGVVFSVKGAYQAEKTKEGLKLKSGVKLKDGQNFIDALIEDQGTASFTAQSIDLVPVFKKGKKVMATTKNGRKINLSNTIISKEMLEEGKIHDIVLSDDNVEYVPYVFGNYDKIIDEDTQTNFSAGVPYSEYALSMQNQNNTRNELTRFEKQEDVQNELLKTYSFTEGNKKAGIKTKSQPTQTKKAPDSTQKQTKIKPMTRDEFNAFAKSKGKVATDDDYKKYLNKLEE
jgi:hypothetical protein